jgi:hypothetical protein
VSNRARFAKLCELLYSEDHAELERVRARGCPSCGGTLHRSDFERKPRGIEGEFKALFSVRFSLCCDREGCRRRRTPRSLRFLGPRFYVGALVVLLCALREGVTPRRLSFLRGAFGVSRRTLERWRSWWREDFASSPFWRVAAGRFADGAGGRDALPRSLWMALRKHSWVNACRFLMCILAPTTTRSITLDEVFT